jgi:hypothetical protein
MIDRLRFLLDRPLDPPAARAVVLSATAILLGFAALFVLGASESNSPQAGGRQASAAQPPRTVYGGERPEATRPAPREPRRRRQDPQDRKGSPAAGRAAKALRSHRALQHVPYRRAHLTVRLVGARGDRAVLAVSAPTITAARRGWRVFLRRYRDSGHTYLIRFEATGGHGG